MATLLPRYVQFEFYFIFLFFYLLNFEFEFNDKINNELILRDMNYIDINKDMTFYF